MSRTILLGQSIVAIGLLLSVCGCGSSNGTGGNSSMGETGGVAQPSGTSGGQSSSTTTGGTNSGGSASGGAATGGAGTGGGSTTAPPEAFELQGSWLYLGPWDGEHTLNITNVSMVYADIAGQWSSNWTISEYDNGLHHFQVDFDSGTGTYFPVGQTMSGTYVLNGGLLTVQLADGAGSYLPVQSPGSCTEGATLIPDCRLYIKQ